LRATAAPDQLLDAVGRGLWPLVLPHPNNFPPLGSEPGVDLTITCDVAVELCLPVARVRSRRCAMGRTSMPEAAVDEDGDPGDAEDHVRKAAKVYEWPPVLAEAQSSSVER
jgi:hypothetical protein